MIDSISNLISHIKKYVPLSPSEEQMILSKITILHSDKKDILENSDTIYNNIYFVNKGCLHLYQITEKGNEQTLQFAIKNWWLTDYDSFNYQKSSMYNIQSLEKSELLALTKSNLEGLLLEIPKLERYFKLIAERAYAASLYRISLIFNYSKEECYLNFLQQFPQFAQQVPQYVLGSYLGISAEYISEIRKKQIQTRS